MVTCIRVTIVRIGGKRTVERNIEETELLQFFGHCTLVVGVRAA